MKCLRVASIVLLAFVWFPLSPVFASHDGT